MGLVRAANALSGLAVRTGPLQLEEYERNIIIVNINVN
jgi:hypothetical protein